MQPSADLKRKLMDKEKVKGIVKEAKEAAKEYTESIQIEFQ
ncbi:1659_t:CDS:1 [Funneliformis mosseae]|uniref:1659_t:CDS:1 n=1 Tax=Funneliformis mosseae TaxID=27381 RepID=A0A9N9NCD1_FUNMO|nr:1659_t:CDS:1 [Funneliformis mosseae]